jgi:serine/threonine protein kinase
MPPLAPSASDRVLAERYRLGSQLEYGDLGRVYRARDQRLGRDVAIKLLDGDQEPAGEALSAAKLTHPGIVRVLDAGRGLGGSYVVMELVDGGSLEQLLDEPGSLAADQALDLAAQIEDASTYATDQGMHAPVSSRNVLLMPDGRAKLVLAPNPEAGGGAPASFATAGELVTGLRAMAATAAKPAPTLRVSRPAVAAPPPPRSMPRALRVHWNVRWLPVIVGFVLLVVLLLLVLTAQRGGSEPAPAPTASAQIESTPLATPTLQPPSAAPPPPRGKPGKKD